MDKLFSDRLNEECANENRRAPENDDTGDNLEAMEGAVKERMGLKEVGNKQRFGKADIILR